MDHCGQNITAEMELNAKLTLKPTCTADKNSLIDKDQTNAGDIHDKQVYGAKCYQIAFPGLLLTAT